MGTEEPLEERTMCCPSFIQEVKSKEPDMSSALVFFVVRIFFDGREQQDVAAWKANVAPSLQMHPQIEKWMHIR